MKIPRHSTIAAYGALFVALGGTSYAATSLSANSVGTTQLKNSAVTRSKLAPNARPYTKRALIDTITTTMTSDQVLSALSTAVQGTPGIKGDQGSVGPAGPAGQNGPQGGRGPKGDRGASLGYLHVGANGVIDTAGSSSNAQVLKPDATSGLYCVSASDAAVHNVVVTLDANDGLLTDNVATRVPNGDACSAYPFEIIVARNGAGVDHGFFATLN